MKPRSTAGNTPIRVVLSSSLHTCRSLDPSRPFVAAADAGRLQRPTPQRHRLGAAAARQQRPNGDGSATLSARAKHAAQNIWWCYFAGGLGVFYVCLRLCMCYDFVTACAKPLGLKGVTPHEPLRLPSFCGMPPTQPQKESTKMFRSSSISVQLA